MNKYSLSMILLLLMVSFSIAGSIKGIVSSKDDGSPLIGANVYLKGTSQGAATDEDGIYYINDVADGSYTIVCEYVGYEAQEQTIEVAGQIQIDFELVGFLTSSAINIVADRAVDRETPVAYTNVSKAKIQETLGSQDIPMVLNTTPNVYATQQGGGAGDARVNVRGFNQRNVAVMINGVPVNDMENGWVYWSNWDGVGDATSSIQMQRGLSAVNLATPSIGGTMNIITDPTALDPGVKLKQEYGSGTMLKTTFSASSGLIDGKYAVSATVVRKLGEGIVDKTWTDAWAYYFGASYNVNDDNRLELYALGAPQRHGQSLYRQNIGAYSKKFAQDLDDYDDRALGQFFETDRGRLYNQTWGPVSSSYKGKQAVGSETFDRYDPNFINERENFFHKPQVNLNWYSQINKDMLLSTVAYYSGGTGGGTGTMGSIRWNYHIGVPSPSRTPAWDATIAKNAASTTGSTGILRNSRNNQYTIGAISKLNYKINENLKTTVGLDWRTAEIDHYREVRDLLGGQYYIPKSYDRSDFWKGDEVKRKLGDKVGYDNTNQVDWLGGFLQAEYKVDNWTAYGTYGVSQIGYSFEDHFTMDPNDTTSTLKLESDKYVGHQIKGGVLNRLSDEWEVYGNFGYVAKAPIFDAVIDDRQGVFAKNPLNEKFTSFEAGANFRSLNGMVTLKASAYYTNWEDRALARTVQSSPGVFDILFLTGLGQVHKGVELELAFQPIDLIRFDVATSLNSWKITSDAKGTFKQVDSEGKPDNEEIYVAVNGLKIGDAPQSQFVFGASVFPIEGLKGQLVFKYFDDFYADYDPTSRTDRSDRKQSWKVPAYSLLDFHGSYKLPIDISGIELKLNMHVFNILDELYVSDAADNSRYNSYQHIDPSSGKKVIRNPHDADAADVFMGLPRRFNIGISLSY